MEVSGQLHSWLRYPPGKKFSLTHWIGGVVGSRASVYVEAKRKAPASNQILTIQAVVRYYINWATLAPYYLPINT
jgi:hypothetical protein